MSANQPPGSPPPGSAGRRIGSALTSATPTVGVAGRQVQGPLGERTITPERAAAAASLSESMRDVAQAKEAEIPEVPEPEKQDEGDDIEEELDANDMYAELQKRAQGGVMGAAVTDPLFAMSLAFLDSKDRRKKIEARIETEMSMSTYVMRREFRQVIRLWPDENGPEVEMRSLTGADNLAMRSILSQTEYIVPLVGELAQPYLLAATGITRIGEDTYEELPRGVRGPEREKLLKKRLEKILDEPADMIFDIYVNHLWFQARMRRVLYGKDATFR